MPISTPHDEALNIMVFTKDLRPRFPLAGYDSASVDLHLDAASSAELRFPLDHLRAWEVTVGDRVVITDRAGGHLMSGPVRSRQVDGVGPAATCSLTVIDDFALLQRTLGWVQPGKGIDQQASDDTSAQWAMKAPAETVAKALFAQNAVARFGAPVTVMPDQRRGATIRVAVRMQPLYDVLYPALTQAGLGLTVRQVQYGAGWRVQMDCFALTTRTPVLTGESPMVEKLTYTETGPEALKGVVGGQGQGNARTFRAGARQDEIDRVGLLYGGEVFNDQRQESTVAGLDTALADELAQKAWTARATLSLIETEEWRYGKSWRLGDLLRIQPFPAAPIVAVPVVAASITDDTSNGYQVTSTADITSTPMDLRASKRLAQRTRALEGA